MTAARTLSRIQKKIWEGSVPLEIRLASSECRDYDQSDPFLVHIPRISYLPLLLPRLLAFFKPSLIESNGSHWDGWFSFEDVPLKWHHPVGLLFDLYSGAKDRLLDDNGGKGLALHGDDVEGQVDPLPWRLIIHFSNWPTEQLVKLDEAGKVLQDAFTNSMKEASFMRHGSGKVVMSLSKDDSTKIWEAVENHDLALFNSVNQKLVHPAGVNLRHIPIKIYLPAASVEDSTGNPTPGHLRVVQSLVTPSLSSRQPQTLGTALNSLLPSLFPSRRSPLLAFPVLHGAVVPLSVGLEELAEYAAYADGFLHIAVAMMS